VVLPNGSTIDYVVDGFGRRIGKKANGVLLREPMSLRHFFRSLWRGLFAVSEAVEGAYLLILTLAGIVGLVWLGVRSCGG
jgi:hypothetical protein